MKEKPAHIIKPCFSNFFWERVQFPWEKPQGMPPTENIEKEKKLKQQCMALLFVFLPYSVKNLDLFGWTQSWFPGKCFLDQLGEIESFSTVYLMISQGTLVEKHYIKLQV